MTVLTILGVIAIIALISFLAIGIHNYALESYRYKIFSIANIGISILILVSLFVANNFIPSGESFLTVWELSKEDLSNIKGPHLDVAVATILAIIIAVYLFVRIARKTSIPIALLSFLLLVIVSVVVIAIVLLISNSKNTKRRRRRRA